MESLDRQTAREKRLPSRQRKTVSGAALLAVDEAAKNWQMQIQIHPERRMTPVIVGMKEIALAANAGVEMYSEEWIELRLASRLWH